MIRNNFAVMILSHGRAGNVLTVDTLKTCGYTGRWYIVVDTGDEQIPQYKQIYGEDHIIIFDKAEVRPTFDMMDNFEGDKLTVFVRNAMFKLAQENNIEYFLELDDDYDNFHSRRWISDRLATIYLRNIDDVFEAYLNFLDDTNADTVCLSQTGDFIGGVSCTMFKKKVTRKAMNAFFFKADRPVKFLGRMNDDVNFYIDSGKRGGLNLTTWDATVHAAETQALKGGLTDTYAQLGTYMKSFYSVMLCPSSVKISESGVQHKRIHHFVDWKLSVPCIISDKFRNY